MTIFIDLESGSKDPLDLIVRHLQGNGIDGFEIKKMRDK